MRQLRITVQAIHFASPKYMVGPHTMGVDITLNGLPFGNAGDTWVVGPAGTIQFDPAVYSTLLDVEHRPDPLALVVTPRLAEPALVRVIGGPLKHTIPWPFSPRSLAPWRLEFTVEWMIENVNPTPDKKSPDGVYACREDKSGAVLYNTVGDVHHSARVEVHSVVPVPYGIGAAGPGPSRPPQDPSRAWTEGGLGKTNEQLAYGSDVNTVWNPSVIPILPASMKPDATNCAKFRVTYYWPKDLAFGEDDSRLVWSTVGAGKAKFFGGKTGRVVTLHGTAAGEIQLELRFDGTQVAIYRALVAPLAIIPYRATILYGHPTNVQLRPRTTPDELQTHILVANRLLWQLGLTLVPFKSTTLGWLPAAIPAANISPIGDQTTLFQATVPPAWTRNDGTISVTLAAAVNSLPYIYNFVYTVLGTGGEGGAGCLMDQAGGTTITDSGTPSTSWIRPSGINPDGGAGSVVMTCMPKYAMFQNTLFPHRFAMYLTDLCPDVYFFGNAIAHELGHVMGLNHRVEGTGSYDDMVQYPPLQNVMRWQPTTTIAQDFDIIQAKQVRFSPLLSPPAGARPAPSP